MDPGSEHRMKPLEQYDNLPEAEEEEAEEEQEQEQEEEEEEQEESISTSGEGASVGDPGVAGELSGEEGGEVERTRDLPAPPPPPSVHVTLDTDSDSCTDSDVFLDKGMATTTDETTSTSESEDTQIWVPAVRPEGRSPPSAPPPSTSKDSDSRLPPPPPPPPLHEAVFKFPTPRKVSPPGVALSAGAATPSTSGASTVPRDPRTASPGLPAPPQLKMHYTGPVNGGARVLQYRRPLVSDPVARGHVEGDNHSLHFTPTLHLPNGGDSERGWSLKGINGQEDCSAYDPTPTFKDKCVPDESADSVARNLLQKTRRFVNDSIPNNSISMEADDTGQDGDEMSRDDGSKSNDDVFLPDTPPPTPDRKQTLESLERSKQNRLNVIDSVCVTLSGLYAVLVVVLGAVLPISEAFSTSQSPHLFQGFYVYLFGTSLLFLIYLYLVLLKTGSCRSRCHGNKNNALLEALSAKAMKKRFTFDDSPHSHTGSFYLRLGAVGFGIGSMIKSGLQFGEYLESDIGFECRSVVYGLRPILNLVFTFTQLYFVFLNSKICIQKHKVLVRFGLMHMVACNLAVWLENIVTETVISIQESVILATHNASFRSLTIPSQRLLSLASCKAGLMRSVVELSGPYLYPCSIEYSLICSGILYVMWRNVGKHVAQRSLEAAHKEAKAKAQRLSVDCSSSSRGLFCGIFILVAVVISIITFFVLTTSVGRSEAAVMVEHISEMVIYVLTSLAVVLAFFKMQSLRFDHKKSLDLEETLLLIGLTGIFIFSLFSIIAATLFSSDMLTLFIVVSSVMRMVQATLQTIFMLNAVRRRAADRSQERDKPGREFVTFLLVANIALWGINTFEVQQSEANPVQLKFYGVLSWNIFTHISSPLAIYYRFHSTVCLSNVWKHAWKKSVYKSSSS